MSGEGGVRENQNFQIAGVWYGLSGLCTEAFCDAAGCEGKL